MKFNLASLAVSAMRARVMSAMDARPDDKESKDASIPGGGPRMDIFSGREMLFLRLAILRCFGRGFAVDDVDG